MQMPILKPSIKVTVLLFILAMLGLPLGTQARPLVSEVSGEITTNTTWTKANSPYLVTGTVTVGNGVSLLIEPGVIVKVGPSYQLRLGTDAQLIANGTVAEPIIFTSIKDDTYGGDSNQDGQATLPAVNDWSGIASYSTGVTSIQLQHVLVRYAYNCIDTIGNLTLQDSTLEHCYNKAINLLPSQTTLPTILLERNTLRKVGLYTGAVSVSGQPGSLSISTNQFVDNWLGLYLQNVDTATVSNNTFTTAVVNATGITVVDVGAGVVLANNTLIYTSIQPATAAGIEVRTSTPQLTNNTVTNFLEPVLINGGYPQTVPTYTNNNFTTNQYQGIVVQGEITTGTWTTFGGYAHFMGSATVANGATLTIPAGAIIKFTPYGQLTLGTGATLLATGTAQQKIVLTSIKDDEQGGDSNRDGQATLPAPGDWYSIAGYSSEATTIQLQHVLMRYGSDCISTSGNLTLQDSTLESCYNRAAALTPSQNIPPTIVLERNTLRKVTASAGAISVIGQPANLTLRNNSFVDNPLSLYLQHIVTADVSNNTFTADDLYATGIILENVGAGVVLANNTLTYTSIEPATAAGIEVRESTPQLTNNTVTNFLEPVLINGGYPQTVPTYTNNNFATNQYQGIVVKGELTAGTWAALGGYAHFMGSATVANGATLTIPPGTIIKFLPYGQLILGTGAKLLATGTNEQPIIFTVIDDDEYGGDANRNGQLTVPVSGSWYGLQALGTASAMQLQFALVRYAYSCLSANGSLSLQDSTVEQCSWNAVNVQPNSDTQPTVTIERSLLRGNYNGIYISSAPANLLINGNAFVQHRNYAINNLDTTATINATGNWWGDDTGPQPAGLGDAISERVNGSNWLTVAPAFVPLPPPTTDGAPAGVADSFEADDSCDQASALSVDDTFQEHTFHAADDTDWVAFTATANTTYRLEVQPPTNSLADVNLEVYTQCNAPATEAWQATFTPGVRLDFKPTQSGTVYLRLTNYDAKIYGDNTNYRLSVRSLKAASQLGAVIIMAGRLKGSDRLQANIHHITQDTYELFRASGYTDDNIYYLATDNSLTGWDAQATLANLQEAITGWAVGKVGADRPLTLYLMDHGGVDTFYVDGVTNQTLAPSALNDWLTQLETSVPNVRINVIIEACHSGSFIAGEQRISKAGRMIITSTNVENVAFASAQGAQFSDRFLSSLREGYSLYNSFWDAQYSVRRLYRSQEPWIDVNGNGIPNELADGAEISQHDPGVDQVAADTWAPYIVTAQGPAQIIDGIGALRTEVRDNKSVKRVWAAVYPPSYQAPGSVEELVPEDVPTFEFVAQGNHQFTAEYANFTEKGVYQVALYAEDNDGLKARLLVLTVANGDTQSIFLPLITR